MQAKYKCKRYPKDAEKYMKQYYKSLNEKSKRMYAWSEAMKLWFWGKKYLHDLLGINHKTLNRWILEFKKEKKKDGIRKKWWWRKTFFESNKSVYEIFDKIMANHTAWDPMSPDVKWTELNPRQIQDIFTRSHNLDISIYLIKKLLKERWYKKRKTAKKKSMWATEYRNEQFLNIERQKEQAIKDKAGVFSMDVKKKRS